MIAAWTLAVCIATARIQAPFECKVIAIRPDRFGYARSYNLQVRRADTRSVVYSRTHKIVVCPTFDRSGKRLAFSDNDFLYIWESKRPLRRYRIPPLPDSSGEGAYEEKGLLWSPDALRLLVWIPATQGDMIPGFGALQVLDLQTGKFRPIASVAKPRWISCSEVEYWVFEYEGGEMAYFGVYRHDLATAGAAPRRQGLEFPKGPFLRHPVRSLNSANRSSVQT